MLTFEIHKNGSFLSRHTVADEAAKAKIVETIRFAHGNGILKKNDGIAVVEVAPKEADPRFVSVESAPKGYRPPPKQKRPVQAQESRPSGLNLGELLTKAGFTAASPQGVAKRR
jgi:hypothetical protein